MKNINSLMTLLIVLIFLSSIESIKGERTYEVKDATDITRPDTSKYVFKNETGLLKEYVRAKPRLILTKERLESLKSQSLEDPVLYGIVDQCLKRARTDLSMALPKYTGSGLMGNQTSWPSFNLITSLSFAYLWTGEVKYAQRVNEIMVTVCNFPDWDSDHFLATGIMGTAVSLGFDWLYDFYDDDTRNLIIHSLIDKLLVTGKTGYSSNAYWTYCDNNWNVICNSSLIIGSLAIAEWHREYADTIIPKAISTLNLVLPNFAPDGAWMEGPGYQQLCLNYYSWLVSCLQTSVNNDLGLVKNYPYVAAGGVNYVALEGRSKNFLCYSDIWGKYKRQAVSGLFFLGALSKNDDLINNEEHFIEEQNASIFHVLWYNNIKQEQPRHSNKYFSGETPIFIFDDDKYGKSSIYLGVKGGTNGSSHGHLDLGNFEFDALGLRWARDLGMDDYNLPGYFDYMKDGGQRYTYYRVSSFSHNVPIINNSNQKILMKSSFLRQSVRKDNPFCIIELTNPYNSYVNKLNRGVKLVDENRSIIVQDEYSLKSDQECYWGMTTDAKITIIDAETAKLSLEGQDLYVKILSDNCTLSCESTAQITPQNINFGVSRLIAKKAKDGILNFSIIVQLSPNWDGYVTGKTVITALADWN